MMKITRDVLESYLACPYKAFLKLQGHENTRREVHLWKSEAGIAPVVIQTREIRALNSQLLKNGADTVENCLYETDHVSLFFDGLQRAAGSSELGDFHYLPLMLRGSGFAGERRRLLLEAFGVVLAQLQGNRPNRGVFWTFVEGF